MKSNWQTREFTEDIVKEFSDNLKIDKYLSSILLSRGITNLKDAYDFLNPRLSSLHSPFLMKGMHEAVMRIREAISGNQKIGIFADSDLDGLTSLTILIKLLERLGVEPYFRFAVDDEDYGLRKEVIEEMFENNIDLLITLDCGIRDIEEIEYARKLSIDVIVCDHHEQGKILPDAIIINPKILECTYPFKELAGVGVTFKFCHGILMSYLQSFNKEFIIISKDRDIIYVSYIVNGTLNAIEQFKDFSDLYYLNHDNNTDNRNIVLYDSEYRELLSGILTNTKIYDFKELLNTILDRKISPKITIDGLCKLFSINKNIIHSKYEIINIIFSEIEYNNSAKITEFLNSIIDLVSIGTIADIMPVLGENRTIIYHGIRSLNSTTHPGLSILVKKISSTITSKNVSWDISPLLNTPGRFGKTNLIASFFLEKDHENIQSVISEINKLNNERKNLIIKLLDSFRDGIDSGKYLFGENLVFIDSEDVPEGLCGLLANRVADITEKPVIVVSLYNNKETVKGSGRAVGNFNFFPYVESYSDLFEKIGGHQQAFGFTIKRENITDLKEKIGSSIGKCEILKTQYYIDLVIELEDLNVQFIKNLDILEPYGHRNKECLFLVKDALIKDFKRFGKNMNHGKYIFHKNNAIEAIGWDKADIMEKYHSREKIDIVCNLENNYYNGSVTPRMLIVDID